MKKIVIFLALMLFPLMMKVNAQDKGRLKDLYRLESEQIPEEMLPDAPYDLNGKDGGNSLNTTLMGRWGYGPCFAIAADSNIAYFGNGAYLEIADISNPSEPVELGRVLLPSVPKRIAISGSYAYLATGESGLRIVDISDATNPREVGFYEMEGYARGIFVEGNYAYLVGDIIGLRIIDITDVANPTEVGYFNTEVFAKNVFVNGNYAYIANGQEGLLVIDVTDVSNPFVVGTYDTGDFALGIFVQDNYAFIADNSDGIRIIDISDVTNLMEVGYYDTSGLAYNIFVTGNYAFIADGWKGLCILDISNVTNPIEVATYNLGNSAYDVYIKNNYVYIANYNGGLRIIDVNDVSTPVEIATFDTPGSSNSLYVKDNYAYVTDGRDGIRIIDISDETNPTEVGFYDIAGTAKDIYVEGNYAYVADYFGLRIIDVSVATNPTEVGFFDAGGYAYGVYVVGDYAFLADGLNGLRIININDVTAPYEVGVCTTEDFAHGVYVLGNYAYVADDRGGLRIIDISDVENPVEVGFYDTGSYAQNVFIKENYAYVADVGDGLRIIDVSDVTNPNEIGYYDTRSLAYNVYIQNNYAFVADANDGLRVLDISNPRNPMEVGYYDTGNWAVGVFVKNNYVFVADDWDGLYIIRNDLAHLYSINIANVSGEVGDTLLVPVTISDVTGLDIISYQFKVNYDPTVVNAVGIETDSTIGSPSGWTIMTNADNEGEISVGAFGSEPLTGEGVLVYLKFVLLRGGSSTELSFSDVVFNNGTPAPGTNNGSITVNCSETTSDLPFFEDFEDGSFCNWTFYKYSTGLNGDVVDPYIENGRLFITTHDQQSTWFTNGLDSWESYSLEFDAKIEQSLDDAYRGIKCYFNMNNITETGTGIIFDAYVLTFKGRDNTWYFSRAYSDGRSGELLASGSVPVQVGTDYHIKILSYPTYFLIYYGEPGSDELLATVNRSADDLIGGKIAFGGADDIISIDNIHVFKSEFVNVSIGDYSVTSGDTLLIPVTVDSLDNRNIISYQFNLLYDPAIATPIEVVTENSLSATGDWSVLGNMNNPGKIIVGAFGSQPLTGDGALLYFKFVFHSNVVDSTQLSLQDFLFNNGTPVAFVQNGNVIVNPEILHLSLPEIMYGSFGDTLLVPLNLLDDVTGKNIISFQYAINFDSTMITPLGVETENSVTNQDDWTVMANTDSAGYIVVGGYGTTPLAGSGIFLRMKFLVKTARNDSTVLRFENFIFNNNYPLASTTNGMIKTNLVFVNLSVPESFNAMPLDTFNVPIFISDITDMGVLAYRVKLTFNPEVITPLGITTQGTLSDKDDWTVLPNINNPGEMVIGGFGAYELTGSGTLIYAKFLASGDGGTSTQLVISEALLNNGYPGVNVTNGVILIGNVQTASEQNIILSQGWNMISSYINPDTTDVEAMMSGIVDNLVLMKNGRGEVYIPEYGIDNIHNWNYVEGYKLYMGEGDTLVVSGQKLNPSETPVALSEGWNMFAYLLDSNRAVNECMSGIENNLVIVKDINGKVYIPEYGINTIGDMVVGYGYKAYMTNEDTLVYSSGTKGTKDKSIEKINYSSVTHYPIVINTSGSDMTLIVNISGYGANSEICIRDMNSGSVVGSGRIVDEKTLISVKGDNAITENIDGARNGDELAIYVWDRENDKEYRIEEYSINDLLGNSTQTEIGKFVYSEDGLYLLSVNENEKVTRFELKQNYPNPFNPVTVIGYSIPERSLVTLKVYNSLGQEIITLVNEVKESGSYRVNFNAGNLSSGIYYYSLSAGKFSSVKKMVLIK